MATITQKTVYIANGKQHNSYAEAASAIEDSAVEILHRIFRKHNVPHSVYVAVTVDILAEKDNLAALFKVDFQPDDRDKEKE